MNQNNTIDLTYSIETNMLTFNAHWHSKVRINQIGRIQKEGRETREICLGTHSGTHIDAPLHFIENGISIDEIPLYRLHGEVDIIDYSYLKNNEYVTKSMLEKIEITERMIFKFGWGKHWGKTGFYKEYPFFTKDAVNYLIEQGIQLVGMDTPSPDDSHIKMGSDEDSYIHKLFLKNGVILVEYLANLDIVDTDLKWNIIAMPLKIKGADGSPARVSIYRR